MACEPLFDCPSDESPVRRAVDNAVDWDEGRSADISLWFVGGMCCVILIVSDSLGAEMRVMKLELRDKA